MQRPTLRRYRRRSTGLCRDLGLDPAGLCAALRAALPCAGRHVRCDVPLRAQVLLRCILIAAAWYHIHMVLSIALFLEGFMGVLFISSCHYTNCMKNKSVIGLFLMILALGRGHSCANAARRVLSPVLLLF